MTLWFQYLQHIDRGFDRAYPRSRMEFGLLLSIGLLVGLATDAPFPSWIGLGCAGGATALYLWRMLVVIRVLGVRGDRQYEKIGKFQLAKEYHETRSATAAKKMKKRG